MGFFFLSEEIGSTVSSEIGRITEGRARTKEDEERWINPYPFYFDKDEFFAVLQSNVQAKIRRRAPKSFKIHRQSGKDNIENALILILNHLPFTKEDVCKMGYKDFLRLINKAKEIVKIKTGK